MLLRTPTDSDLLTTFAAFVVMVIYRVLRRKMAAVEIYRQSLLTVNLCLFISLSLSLSLPVCVYVCVSVCVCKVTYKNALAQAYDCTIYY